VFVAVGGTGVSVGTAGVFVGVNVLWGATPWFAPVSATAAANAAIAAGPSVKIVRRV
jgi:hypothetical protein